MVKLSSECRDAVLGVVVDLTGQSMEIDCGTEISRDETCDRWVWREGATERATEVSPDKEA